MSINKYLNIITAPNNVYKNWKTTGITKIAPRQIDITSLATLGTAQSNTQNSTTIIPNFTLSSPSIEDASSTIQTCKMIST